MPQQTLPQFAPSLDHQFDAAKKFLARKSLKVNSKRKRRQHSRHFAIYIEKVLKQVHPGMGITKTSMSVMNSFLSDVIERIVEESTRLMLLACLRTLTHRQVSTACKLIMPRDLAKHACHEAHKAMKKYAGDV